MLSTTLFFLQIKLIDLKGGRTLTIKERNEYLKIQSWQQKEKQHEFDLSRITTGKRFDNKSQILRVVGFEDSDSTGNGSYAFKRLENYVSFKTMDNGQIKVTKVKGETVTNPFSWELATPIMSTRYMLELMIIYILDNHLNDNWDKHEWCRQLGLYTADKDSYDINSFKFMEEYFNEGYKCMMKIGQRRLRFAFNSLEERGVIKRKYSLMCKNKHSETEFRNLSEKELEEYSDVTQTLLRTMRKVDTNEIIFYTSVYPKFLKMASTYSHLKDLEFKLIVDAEYLYPKEHSYLTEYEFYTYQKRVQSNILPKVTTLLCNSKDDFINKCINRHWNKIESTLYESGIQNDILSIFKDSMTDYYRKEFSTFKTTSRETIKFIFRGGQ